MKNVLSTSLSATSSMAILLTILMLSGISVTQVYASNTHPTVSIVRPVANQHFTQGAAIKLVATASDPDGSISSVNFYNGTKLLGTGIPIANNQYSFIWNYAAAGTYNIKAKAKDNLNAGTNSAIVNITVDESHLLNTTASNGTRYLDKVFDSSQIKITRGIKYGGALNDVGVWKNLTLDLYEPNRHNDMEMHRPVILIIHPGGFVGGANNSPEMATWANEWFAPRGYVAVSINYRLSSTANDNFTNRTNATSDAQAAIRFLRAHASDYHIDPNRIIPMGESAGAITSEMVAISSQIDTKWEELYPTMHQNNSNPGYPSWVAAAISESGDVANDFLSAQLDSFDVGTVVDFHGTMDETVPYYLGASTIDSFTHSGINATLYSYNDTHHTDFSDSDENDIETKAVQTLFDRVIQGDQCPAPNMKVPQIAWSSNLNPRMEATQNEIEENESPISFIISPNPAKESFKLQFSSADVVPSDAMMVISDENRNKIMEMKFQVLPGEFSKQIQLNKELVPGIYLVNIFMDGKIISQPLLVQY